MAYKVIILYQLYMPSYFLGTFTEYPDLETSRIPLSVLFCIIEKERSYSKNKDRIFLVIALSHL